MRSPDLTDVNRALFGRGSAGYGHTLPDGAGVHDVLVSSQRFVLALNHDMRVLLDKDDSTTADVAALLLPDPKVQAYAVPHERIVLCNEGLIRYIRMEVATDVVSGLATALRERPEMTGDELPFQLAEIADYLRLRSLGMFVSADPPEAPWRWFTHSMKSTLDATVALCLSFVMLHECGHLRSSGAMTSTRATIVPELPLPEAMDQNKEDELAADSFALSVVQKLARDRLAAAAVHFFTAHTRADYLFRGDGASHPFALNRIGHLARVFPDLDPLVHIVTQAGISLGIQFARTIAGGACSPNARRDAIRHKLAAARPPQDVEIVITKASELAEAWGVLADPWDGRAMVLETAAIAP